MEQLFGEMSLANSWGKILKKLKGKIQNYLLPRNG